MSAPRRIAVTVIGTNLVMDYGTNEAAIAAMESMMTADRLDRLAKQLAEQVEEWSLLAHDFRVYAQHAPMCNYRPTYPESPVATCDCEFDELLDRYDRALGSREGSRNP